MENKPETTTPDAIDQRDFVLIEAAQKILGMVSGRMTNTKVTDAFELLNIQLQEMQRRYAG